MLDIDPREDHVGVLSASSATRHEAQREKRRGYFLKGPVEFGWIVDNIPDPTSRVILVARAFMVMNDKNEWALDAKVWNCAGVTDRYQRRRVLQRIRDVVHDYRVIDRPGRTAVLKFTGSATETARAADVRPKRNWAG